MIPPRDVFDATGRAYEGPERRDGYPRRDDDMRDDALDPAILLGYEAWAGRVWRHRGKLAAIIGLAGSAAGCVAGYLGRAGDLAKMDSRLTRVEGAQAILQQNEDAKMNMLCSLTRRIDPLGLPLQCQPRAKP
jgi:hypothetical protein